MRGREAAWTKRCCRAEQRTRRKTFSVLSVSAGVEGKRLNGTVTHIGTCMMRFGQSGRKTDGKTDRQTHRQEMRHGDRQEDK